MLVIAVTDSTVFITRPCGHIVVANSKALELAGVTKDTPNPAGGQIDRDENGQQLKWQKNTVAKWLSIQWVSKQSTKSTGTFANVDNWIDGARSIRIEHAAMPTEYAL